MKVLDMGGCTGGDERRRTVVLPALSRPRKRSFACLFARPSWASTSQTIYRCQPSLVLCLRDRGIHTPVDDPHDVRNTSIETESSRERWTLVVAWNLKPLKAGRRSQRSCMKPRNPIRRRWMMLRPILTCRPFISAKPVPVLHISRLAKVPGFVGDTSLEPQANCRIGKVR